MTTTLHCPWADMARIFLLRIGLDVRIERGATGFVPGILIRKGRLIVDPAAQASNLLHEAGHLACVPAHLRHLMDGDVSSGIRAMLDIVMAEPQEPDSPLMRAVFQCSDPEATAWAWAAGMELRLPHEVIIDDRDYDGIGASIRTMLQARAYLGINGLAHAGMTEKPGPFKSYGSSYPIMKRWTQPDMREVT